MKLALLPILGLLIAATTQPTSQPSTQPTTGPSVLDGVWKDLLGGLCTIAGMDGSLVIIDARKHVGHGVYLPDNLLIVSQSDFGNATVKPDASVLFSSNPAEHSPWTRATQPSTNP